MYKSQRPGHCSKNVSRGNKESHIAFNIAMVDSCVTPKPAGPDMHGTGPRDYFSAMTSRTRQK